MSFSDPVEMQMQCSFQVNIVLKATISPKWTLLILTHLDTALPLWWHPFEIVIRLQV